MESLLKGRVSLLQLFLSPGFVFILSVYMLSGLVLIKACLILLQKGVQIKPPVSYVLRYGSPQYISSGSQAHLVLIEGTLV